MELTEDIKNVAQRLGQTLRQDSHVRAYVEALKKLESDPEAKALEKKMYDMYEALLARQQASERLSQQEIQAFNELRRQVMSHPLISQRDEMLRLLKPQLAEIADEIGFALGIDYTVLARPQ